MLDVVQRVFPEVLPARDVRLFFVTADDPPHARRVKLAIICGAVRAENAALVLSELTEYLADFDVAFVRRAVRAVGTAVGRNPISWLIPCHRALRKSGGLGGYHWGLPMKRAMLAYESARAE